MILGVRAGATILLLLTMLYSFGTFQADGIHLAEYIVDASHITTARALLNFQLFWSDIPALGVGHDSQFFNGAVFPHTGYGVALLQVPFHYFWNLFSSSDSFTPFPDRLIFLFYCFATIAFIYFSFVRFLSSMNFASHLQRELLAMAMSLVLCAHTIFSIMSMYFRVYEANTAYFFLAEIVACLSVIHFRQTRLHRWLILTGLMSGIGLLIRPTGLLLTGFWVFAIIFPHTENRIKTLRSYSLALFPFVVFWCFSNFIRSGHIFSSGFLNVIPLIPEMHVLRFGGNPCFTGIGSFFSFFVLLFSNIFGTWDGRGGFYIDNLPAAFQNCGLIFESADISPMRAPFIPFWISVGTLVITGFQFFLKKRFDLVVAFFGMFFLLVLYTRGQSGFGARYVVDFWPLISFIWISSLVTLDRSSISSRMAWGCIVVFFGLSISVLVTDVYKQIQQRQWVAPSPSRQIINPSVFHREEKAYELLNWMTKVGRPVDYIAALMSAEFRLSSIRKSGDPAIINMAEDKVGWAADGTVYDLSYFYLLVPKKDGEDYELLLNTDEISPREIQIYLNGTVIKTQASGTQTRANFKISVDKLFSPVVAVVVQWSRSFGPTGIRLHSVELK